MGRVRGEEKRREEKRREEKKKEEQRRESQKKEDAGARKSRKVAKHCLFPMICGSGGSRSRLPRAAGAEPSGQMRDEKLHAVVARSTFPSQNVQTTSASDHFWKLRCPKSARCCCARSTFPSQNAQDTSCSDHFWKLRCPKSARCCGAKHISKFMFDHSWKLRCPKSARRCGAKDISKSKCTKHHMFAPRLDVEASFCVAGARDSPPCHK